MDWPIRYKDIAPWYDYVEDFVGISGKPEGLPQLPDGRYLPANGNELRRRPLFASRSAEHYTDRTVTIARVANLSRAMERPRPMPVPQPLQPGLPFSGYFSSNAATLPAAAATNNLTLIPGLHRIEIIYDDKITEQQASASSTRIPDR